MNAALAVGADVAFIEAPQTIEEIAAVPAARERALTALASSRGGISPSPPGGPADLGDGPAALFRWVGSDEWDRLRERYTSIESATPGVTE